MSLRIPQLKYLDKATNLNETFDFNCNETGQIENDPLRLIGKRICEKFQIVDYLDSGGMSHIYFIKDKRGSDFALKILKRTMININSLRRFQNEIEIMSLFKDNPNIVNVKEFGTFDGNPFIIMEYADGGYLYKRQKDNSLLFLDALKFIAGACNGLIALHSKGFVHRDIKPHNILIVKNVGKLGDFGLSKESNKDKTQTYGNLINGTINYISPEQIDPQNLGINWYSDVYSLGATLFHVLTGRPPFSGSVYQIIRQHVEYNSPNPQSINPNIPDSLNQIILKAMSKNPEERPSVIEVHNCILEELCKRKLSYLKLPELVEQI